jgi:hypothetical protein
VASARDTHLFVELELRHGFVAVAFGEFLEEQIAWKERGKKME